jgi:uncharacterized protein (DUF2252 family)
MNIVPATKSYENWMHRCTHVVEGDLRYKHQQMRKDPFLFFRSTFYRWVEFWPELCRDLCHAPKVLAVSDAAKEMAKATERYWKKYCRH